MKFLELDTLEGTKSKVTKIHAMPYDEKHGLTEEELAKGILVDEVLQAEIYQGKGVIHYANPQTKEQWFEYVERPLTEPERIAELENTLAMLLLK